MQSSTIKCSIVGLIIVILTNACNYSREQDIPETVSVKSTSEICSFSIYKVSKYSLDGVESTKTYDWQKGLVCEGYSDRPMNMPWTDYAELSTKRKSTLTYFFENLEGCDDYRLDLDNLWVAACQTETVNEATGKLNIKYHFLYLLDRKKSLLYEVRNLD